MPTVVELKDANGLPTHQKTVLLFYAAWHESTAAMQNVLQALAASAPDDMVFGQVAAEEVPALSKRFGITQVPTFVLLRADGRTAQTVQGAHLIPELTQAVQKLSQNSNDDDDDTGEDTTTPTLQPDPQAQLTARLDSLIRSAPVMLFMKGTPDAPRCGFSRQAVQLLQDEHIAFGSFDILSDNDVRQGLKTHSDWPTYPQLYVHGELMGGLDIMKEMKEESSLQNGLGLTDDDLALLSANQTTNPMQSLNDRLKELIHSHKVMLFMKGLPSAPRCGFSRQMVELLEATEVSYGTFDILTDEDVRQGLKKYSDWPTYPQLYVNGELVGGLDIVKEMNEDGSLKETLAG